MTSPPFRRALVLVAFLVMPHTWRGTVSTFAGQGVTLPDTPLTFGAFDATFRADGTFSLEGQGWPSMTGSWRAEAAEVLLMISGGPKGCDGPGRYRFNVEGRDVRFALVSDDCVPRRMILGRSSGGRGDTRLVPARRIVLTPAGAVRSHGPQPRPAAGRRFAARRRGRRRRPAPARPVGRHAGREHPVAHADSRAWRTRARRLGRSDLRDERRQQHAQRDVQARTLRRRRRLGRSIARSAGCSTRSTSAPARCAWERIAHEGEPREQAAHQVHLRERDARHRRPHRRRVVRIAGRPCLRRRRRLARGRSISGASTWAPTTFPRTSGGRRARRSSGTAW